MSARQKPHPVDPRTPRRQSRPKPPQPKQQPKPPQQPKKNSALPAAALAEAQRIADEAPPLSIAQQECIRVMFAGAFDHLAVAA